MLDEGLAWSDGNRAILPLARSVAMLLLVIVLSGCHGFQPARPQTLATIAAMPLARELPAEQFVIEIESPRLTGVFDAVCAVEPAGFKLQLFPDVGGKVMDLALAGGSLTAETPAGLYAAAAPFAAAEPHLALILAAMLAELVAPVDASRVLGERGGGTAGVPVEVRLLPALGSGQVVATLAPDGHILCYRIALGWLDIALRADGSYSGPGFSGRLWP